MEGGPVDEVFEITSKDYQKLAKSLQKEGYREGKSSADEQIFQKSFDKGYEDGFRVGFVLGKLSKKDAKLGYCEMCKNGSLISSKTEAEIREINRISYENALKESE